MDRSEVAGYHWDSAQLTSAHQYLLPAVRREMAKLAAECTAAQRRRRVFDLGCGNGSVANDISKAGWEVLGIDPSTTGIAQAKQHFPNLSLHEGSAYEDLAALYGQFPVVISLEVVEHVYDPRRYASTLFTLVEPGGTAIVSTPYHGYWKNLALAVTGRLDAHFTALWDHGHIKFWSVKTLSILLKEVGFNNIRFERVGRLSALAKSMIAIAQKP